MNPLPSRLRSPVRQTVCSGRRLFPLGLLAACLAVGPALGAPPVTPHVVSALPVDDIVILDGYSTAAPVTVDVLRGGLRIGSSGLVAVSADGTVGINHPAPAPDCWQGWTPDITNGDVVRVTKDAIVEETGVQNLTTGAPENTNPTVTVHGTARNAGGARLPIGELELRLGSQGFGPILGGGPFILAPGSKGQNGTTATGTLTYDNPTDPNWTATFTFTGLDSDSAQVVAAAAGAEIGWLSPGATESTVTADAPDPLGAACPTTPFGRYATTKTTPNVVSNITPTLTVAGPADAAAISVSVTLTGGLASVTSPGILSQPSGGGQIWTATFDATQIDDLPDGVVTATPTFDFVVPGPVTGLSRTLLKTLDGLPPAPTITAGPANGSTRLVSDAQFAFTSPVNDATFECKLDEGAFAACTSPRTVSNLPNRSYTFHVRALDGTTPGPPASRTWTVARPPPVAQIVAGPPNPTNQTTATFDLFSSLPVLRYECSLDEAPTFTSCADPAIFLGLSAGSHAMIVHAVDDALNVGPDTNAFPWIIDLTPPTTTITSAPAAKVNVTTAVFEMTSNDSTATFECKLDKGGFAGCPTPATFTDLADGVHTMQIRAKDLAGNVDATPETRSWDVNGPPATSLTSAPSASTTGTTAAFGFTSPDDPAATFECSLDGAPFGFCATPVNYSGLGLGNHTFRVRAVDALGTADPTPATHAWMITPADTEPPAVSASMAATRKLTVGRNGILVVTASCDERCTIIAKATVTVPSPLTGGKRTLYTITSNTIDAAAGASGQVRIKLTGRQLRAVRNSLKAGKRVRITITVIGTDASGNRSNALRVVTMTKSNL